jgi:linoleoyl-CoA desaturase
MSFKPVSFSKEHNEMFYKTLKQRVNAYFKENEISKYANATMVTKTVLMSLIYFVPFILLLFFISNPWISLLAWVMMGFGMAGLGLSVMHDANHGAYSKHEKVNKYVGYIMYFIGGSDVNWRIQHNILHHTYTNVTGMDEDINPGSILRFTPHEKLRKHHRYQHWYAWFLYGFMTMLWFLTKDYKQAIRYEKYGLTSTQRTTFRSHLIKLIIAKIAYAFVLLVLPMFLVDYSFLFVLIGFCVMQFIAGLTLACIFQPAHVVPTSDYPLPDNSGNIEADWAVSQLCNTANFAPKARLFSWYVGGLNFQVEHHLFPTICHVHYKRISEIVRETALEFNLPYYSYKTFYGALREHTKMLKMLGQNEIAPAIHH